MTFALGLLLFRRPFPKPAIIFLGICTMALLEFAFASLADAIETERHLFLFHFMTEITICFAVVWALDGIARKFPRSRRTRQELLAPCGPAAA